MLVLDGIEYFVEKEVSARYGLSVHWFRNARYSNNSPKYYKLNGRVLYTIADIDNWMRAHLMSK
jgi:hypothetical protein